MGDAGAPVLAAPQLPPAEFGNGQYERHAELGHGASGRVFECKRCGAEETLAVKVMNLRGIRLSVNAERDLRRLHRELDILRQLPPHPRIVQMVDAFEEGDWFFLVLELVRGGDLFGVLMDRPGPRPRLMEKEASHVFWQLVEGLAFLHSQSVIHRDLKLENILIASETRDGPLVLYSVKISDFGLSKAVGLGVSRAHSTVGTRRYVAPEVLRGGAYDFRVDLWSLGILVYILLQGSYPHDRPTHVTQENLNNILSRIDGSQAARSIISGLLQLDPSSRVTLEELQCRTWSGDVDPANSAKIVRVDSASPVHTESLFGSEVMDVTLPPPAPGATAMASSSIFSGGMLDADFRALEPEPEPRGAPVSGDGLCVGPSVKSVLEIGKQEGLLPSSSGVEAQEASVAPLPAPQEQPCESTPAPLLVRDPASGVALSNVRAASAAVHEMHLHLVVPDRFAGLVLGKAGARLKHVKANTGCNTWMTPRDGNKDRSVVILGSYGQCSLAQTMFLDYLSEAMSMQKEELKEVTVVIFLRNEVVGTVIGKQGTCLRQVHKQSNARIDVLREEVEGKRPCIIVGKFQHVLQAEKLIDDLVQSVPPPRINNAAGPSPTLLPSSSKRAATAADVLAIAAASTASHGATAKRPRREEAHFELRNEQQLGKTKLLIPVQKAGAVIGKHGSGLQHIRETCDVKLEVLQPSQASQWQGEQLVIIHGSVAARQQGADAVLRAAFSSQSSSMCTLKMLVQVPKHDTLSEAVSKVSSICGDVAHVCPNAVEDVGEHLIRLEGQLPQVSAALSILGLLEQTPHSDSAQATCKAEPVKSTAPFHVGRARGTGKPARTSRGRGGRV